MEQPKDLKVCSESENVLFQDEIILLQYLPAEVH